MEADIGTICISKEGKQGGTCRPPLPYPPPFPPPLLQRVAGKQHCKKFAKHKILIKLF